MIDTQRPCHGDVWEQVPMREGSRSPRGRFVVLHVCGHPDREADAMSETRTKPKRGDVWIGGGYRVLITSQRFDRVSFVRLNSEAKGTPVRCDLDQFLMAYQREVRDD